MLSIFASSAGSGKTFTLAKEYLKLLLQSDDPFYFKKILAVTFTNDAANEMKARILKFLAIISEDLDVENTITQQIFAEIPNQYHPFLLQRAKIAHQHILFHYADFAVLTIDGFENAVVNSHGYQLGLVGNFELILDAEDIIIPATERILAKIGMLGHEALTQNILNYMTQLAQEDKSWNRLSDHLQVFGEGLLRESGINFYKDFEGLTVDILNRIQKQLTDEFFQLKNKLMATAAQYVNIAQNEGLTESDFAGGGTSGAYKMMNNRALKAKAFEDLPSDSLIEKHLQRTLINKKYKGNISAGFEEQLVSIFDTYRALQTKCLLLKEILKNSSSTALFTIFFDEINQLKDEGKVHISYFNKAIDQVVSTQPLPFIFERLGVRLTHIMIDEFQDTSSLQFQNFMPLIANALAEGTALLVGDAKQSIYRWRGGNINQFIHIAQSDIPYFLNQYADNEYVAQHFLDIEGKISPKSLQTNYRSSAQIIAFNNKLFDFCGNTNSPILPLVPSLQSVYGLGSQQDIPLSASNHGHVEISFLDLKQPIDVPEGIDKLADLYASMVLQKIKESLALGYEYNDIAVICRKNKDGYFLANYLKNNSIPIVSSESLLINSSEQVRFLVAFLKLLAYDTPSHRFDCLNLYYQNILQKNIDLDFDTQQYFLLNVELNLFFGFFKVIDFEHLTGLGLSATALYLQRVLCQNITNDLEYLNAFYDVLLKFEVQNGKNLDDFLKYWAAKSKKLSVSANRQDGVIITSIHKAKGLEYEVVILPMANWPLIPRHSNQRWLHLQNITLPELTDTETGQKLNYALCNYTSNLKEVGLDDQLAIWVEDTALEVLNMLYVAATRAISRLYILSETNEKQEVNTIGDVLWLFAKTFSHELPKNKPFYFHENFEPKTKSSQKKKRSEILYEPKPLNELTTVLSIKATDFETKEQLQKIELGNLLHNFMAEVTDNSSIDQKLNEFCQIQNLSNEDYTFLKSAVYKIILHDQVAAFFKPGLKVQNEVEIYLPSGTIIRPDRLVHLANKTIIIDYKTGVESDSHMQQIRHYAKILQDMGYQNIEKYLIYVENAKVLAIK